MNVSAVMNNAVYRAVDQVLTNAAHANTSKMAHSVFPLAQQTNTRNKVNVIIAIQIALEDALALKTLLVSAVAILVIRLS